MHAGAVERAQSELKRCACAPELAVEQECFSWLGEQLDQPSSATFAWEAASREVSRRQALSAATRSLQACCAGAWGHGRLINRPRAGW